MQYRLSNEEFSMYLKNIWNPKSTQRFFLYIILYSNNIINFIFYSSFI